MTPQPSYRIFRAGWIMARAFTPHLLLAPLAYPWSIMSVIPGTLRRGLYLDSTRTGMVMLYRSHQLLDFLVLMPVMIAAMAVYGVVAPALVGFVLPEDMVVPLLAAVPLLFMVGLLFLLPRGGGSMFPFGPETPKGERWEVAGLAQLPGTRLTGIQLALRVVEDVPPPGAVVVATANSSKLLHQYQQFVFTEGRNKRVYKIVR